MNETISAYLAGYLERGGAVRIYVNKGGDDSPVIDTESGLSSPIESAGIYVRVRSSDMTVLRLLKEEFDGKLSNGQWQGWNESAALLLRAIAPYLRTGKRRAVVGLALEFYGFLEEKKEIAAGAVLFFTVEDVERIARYEAALKEITGSK